MLNIGNRFSFLRQINLYNSCHLFLFLNMCSFRFVFIFRNAYKQIVTCRRCAELLQDKGHRYQPCKVLTFELLVMKTLNYNLHVASPLSYIETLLEIMGQFLFPSFVFCYRFDAEFEIHKTKALIHTCMNV